MTRKNKRATRRGTVLLMIVGLLAMLFIIVSAYIMLARFDRQTIGWAGRGDRMNEVVDAINDVAIGSIKGTAGGDLVSGANYTAVPGGMQSPWLGPAEPVRDPNVTSALPINYSYPTLSNFTGTSTAPKRLTDLLLDKDKNGSVEIRQAPGSPPNAAGLNADTLANARQPFADATGTGMPDSYFPAVATLTELANAMGGGAASATGIDPSQLDVNSTDPNMQRKVALWQQFDTQAQYAVAARVVSHGGMVQVSLPSLARNPGPTEIPPWNDVFLSGMFNWVEHFNDVRSGKFLDLSQAGDRAALRAMDASKAAVEPLLRIRGGVLMPANAQAGNLPPALAVLQNQFPWTFDPNYPNRTSGGNWERFNLADPVDWNTWRQAITVDATAYNGYFASGGQDPHALFAPRQSLTTVNNSDELARIERTDPNDPNLPRGLRPGQLKYYLGNITDRTTFPSSSVLRGAFNLDGTFNDTSRAPNKSKEQGFVVVREVADYYYEMLAGYSGWRGDPNATEAVTRGEQALMLAVNTVAAAGPSYPITPDAVYYIDSDGKTYVGYSPQPFITHVVTCNTPPDPNDPIDPNSPELAVGVQLYNPDDELASDPNHAPLDLRRFQLTITSASGGGGGQPTQVIVDLSASLQTTMPGRTFLAFAVGARAASVFPGVTPVTGSLTYHDNEIIRVALQKQGPSKLGTWYTVDQTVIDPSKSQSAHGANDKWSVDVPRDITYEPYLGNMAVGGYPAYRMVVGDDPNQITVVGSAPDPNVLSQLISPRPAISPIGNTNPCVPLYVPFTQPGTVTTVHGALRPGSFPTVGFLLFVPRFAHLSGATDPNQMGPMSTMLRQQWEKRKSATGSTTPPADFGHMPVFDNKQNANASIGGFKATGRIPWGLLVYDYFTTLDPNDPNHPVDPYRVPGRININTAPWYVLAGLPVIGPEPAVQSNPNGSPLPLSRGLPLAFWSNQAGVLVGLGSDGTPRFGPLNLSNGLVANGTFTWQLGPYLAQAAAAYRDRVAYTTYQSTANAPFNLAWARADTNGSYNPNDPLLYRPALYGSVRGQTEIIDPNDLSYDPTLVKRGFLSVGELANVMGFDSCTTPSDVNPLTDPVVNGDYMKAVSLLALLDTHFLTTRSNTFTIYATLTDRKNPQASIRSQVTIDRSNLLPRLIWEDLNHNGIADPPGLAGDAYTIVQDNGDPEVIGERQVSYANARYDN